MSGICDAHKKKVGIELLYNLVHRKFNQLEIRPVGEKMLEWGTCPREAGPPGPRLSNPGKRERNTVMTIRVGVNMLQFCSVSNSLSHSKTFSNPFEPFQIKCEVYFSKELCRRYDSACTCICMYGCDYTTGYSMPNLLYTYILNI